MQPDIFKDLSWRAWNLLHILITSGKIKGKDLQDNQGPVPDPLVLLLNSLLSFLPNSANEQVMTKHSSFTITTQ